MATLPVGVRISGLDFDDDATFQVLGEKYPDTFLAGEQPCVLMMSVSDADPVSAVVELVRAMQADLPQLRVHGVDRDLVGTTDIAHRAGVSREGARKWSQAEGFPQPFDYLQTASMPVWAWTEVAQWLKEARGLEVDDPLPTVQVLTQIENSLMRNPDHTTIEWPQIQYPSRTPGHVMNRDFALSALERSVAAASRFGATPNFQPIPVR